MTELRDGVVLDVHGTDIHAECELLREQGPIAQIELPGNVRAWSVVGYDMVHQVLLDERFAKSPKHWTAYVNGEIDENFPLIGWVLMENMTTADGDDHIRLRKLIANAFTNRRVEAMRPYIERLVDGLLDDLATVAPGEPVDLKKRFAQALPVQVICDLFGIPEERRAEVLRGGEVNVDTTITHEEAVANVEQWHQAIFDVIELKRREPGDDLLSALIAAQDDDGRKLTDGEMAGTLHLMLGAGSETTTNLIANSVVALLTHPEQLELVRRGEVPWREVIEEVLRVESPISQLPFRFTTEEVELAGVTIPAGDPVLISFAAAGRDPQRHGQTAGTFDITRTDKSHVSFGHGVHHCLGAPLGRLEGAVALPALFERFPDITLAVDPAELAPQGTFLLNGWAEVPVLLTAPAPSTVEAAPITPFRFEAAQADLDDLCRRLADTRWPAEIPGAGWTRGTPVGYLKELAEYWRTGFDWRAVERRLNEFPQFTTEIDGATVHFFHVRSAEPDALPLLMTHGWPSTSAEFVDVIEALTDPGKHGGDASQAFHVVIPTIPGFGFSGPQPEAGWGIERIAAAWRALMARLGYDRYVTHGGDLGTWISLALAAIDPEHVIGAHVNFLVTPPTGDPGEMASLEPEDFARLGKLQEWVVNRSGYMKIQGTRPQSLAYGLTDSPVGLLAWITEKFYEWTGSVDSPEEAVTRDQLLANVTLSWLTGTAGSSTQIYFEMADQLPIAVPPPPLAPPLPVPLGVAVFANDASLAIRKLADPRFPNIVQWNEYDRGGHFPAIEQPQLLVLDLRSFAAALSR